VEKPPRRDPYLTARGQALRLRGTGLARFALGDRRGKGTAGRLRKRAVDKVALIEVSVNALALTELS